MQTIAQSKAFREWARELLAREPKEPVRINDQLLLALKTETVKPT